VTHNLNVSYSKIDVETNLTILVICTYPVYRTTDVEFCCFVAGSLWPA